MVGMMDPSQWAYGSSTVSSPYGQQQNPYGGGGYGYPAGWWGDGQGSTWNDGSNLQYDDRGRLIAPTQQIGGQTGSYGAYGSTGATGGATAGANPYGSYGSESYGSATYGRDPNSATAIAFLNSVISGNKLPMDQTAQNNQLSQQSGMASAAESARNNAQAGAAAANGASIYDPSLQGARMNNMATRQAANMNSQNRIAQGAANANFGAQMDAAGSLANLGLAQEDRMARAQAIGVNNTRGTGTLGFNPDGTNRVQGYGYSAGNTGLDWADSGYANGDGSGSTQPGTAPNTGGGSSTNDYWANIRATRAAGG